MNAAPLNGLWLDEMLHDWQCSRAVSIGLGPSLSDIDITAQFKAASSRCPRALTKKPRSRASARGNGGRHC